MKDLEKIKKKLQDSFDNLEINEDSDIPVSEKKVKDKKFREF